MSAIHQRRDRVKVFVKSLVEREWLKGNVLAMQQYEKAVKLPPLLAAV